MCHLIEHPVFSLVLTYLNQGRFQVFLHHKKIFENHENFETNKSDIFFVCDIDLKIDIKTLERIRMITADNKVYFPMFFRLIYKKSRTLTTARTVRFLKSYRYCKP